MMLSQRWAYMQAASWCVVGRLSHLLGTLNTLPPPNPKP